MKLLARAIKFFTFYLFIKFGLTNYDISSEWYNQNIFVFLLVYLPILAGYEDIASTIMKAIIGIKD